MSLFGLLFFPPGPDFKTLVTPLVKHVRLHLIDPQDIMKVYTDRYTHIQSENYTSMFICR